MSAVPPSSISSSTEGSGSGGHDRANDHHYDSLNSKTSHAVTNKHNASSGENWKGENFRGGRGKERGRGFNKGTIPYRGRGGAGGRRGGRARGRGRGGPHAGRMHHKRDDAHSMGESHRPNGRRHRPRAKGGDYHSSNREEPEEKRIRFETPSTSSSADGVLNGIQHDPFSAESSTAFPSSHLPSNTTTTSPSVSNFAQLHAALNSPESITLYLKDKDRKESILTDNKTLQTFIAAALSGRPEEMWIEWITNCKGDVFDILFALYSLATTTSRQNNNCNRASSASCVGGKGGRPSILLRPSSHEFLIQLEKHGVCHSSWEASLNAPPYNVDTSLLSPKAMLKQLAALDPFARLQRWIELSHTPEDLHVCGEKMQAFWMEEFTQSQFQQKQQQEEEEVRKQAEEEGGKAGCESEASEQWSSSSPLGKRSGVSHPAGGGGSLSLKEEKKRGGDYESRCMLLSKWVSKMRRVADSTTVVEAAAEGETTTEEIEGEGVSEKPLSITEEKKMENEDSMQPSSPGVAPCSHDEDGLNGKVDKDDEEKSKSRAEKVPQYLCWSKAQRQLMKDSFSMAVEWLGRIMNVSQAGANGGSWVMHLRSPTGKLLRYAEWASLLKLVRIRDVEKLRTLDDTAKESLSQTVLQMELVSQIKEIPPGDSEALQRLLDKLWEEESEEGNHKKNKKKIATESDDEDDTVEEEKGKDKLNTTSVSTSSSARAALRGCFSPSSSDVLSSIATAVSHASIDPALEELTTRRLIATQHSLRRKFLQQQAAAATGTKTNENSSFPSSGSSSIVPSGGVPLHPPQLPRRALRLIEKYAQKERQAILTKRIDELKKEA